MTTASRRTVFGLPSVEISCVHSWTRRRAVRQRSSHSGLTIHRPLRTPCPTVDSAACDWCPLNLPPSTFTGVFQHKLRAQHCTLRIPARARAALPAFLFLPRVPLCVMHPSVSEKCSFPRALGPAYFSFSIPTGHSSKSGSAAANKHDTERTCMYFIVLAAATRSPFGDDGAVFARQQRAFNAARSV